MNFNKIEEFGKSIFARNPDLRRKLKRVYQQTSYILSTDKIKSEGNIQRINPDNEFEYFFGYYDKIPWDKNDRYLISLKVENAAESPAPKRKAVIVLFDTWNNNNEIEIATTHTWNSQQGCMAQWLGPDFESKIIYNDFRENKYVSVVYDVSAKREEKVLPKPVYEVSKDGKYGYTLDFSRLHRLRPGYGYSNIDDRTEGELIPDKPALEKIDLNTGKVEPLLSYVDLYKFETRPEMKGAEHKINHIMVNPSGDRLMLLHRWYLNGEKFSRLVTLNTDGTGLYNLNDDNFNSHAFWKNDSTILIFANKKEHGKGYYLLEDKTDNFKLIWQELDTDGHMSYTKDLSKVVTDTYPNRKRIASVFVIYNEEKIDKVARVFAPFKYDNDVRCDLHPRWNNVGNTICIDSTHEGKRSIYTIKLEGNEK